MAACILDEMIEIILLKLPITSLLRFKSVSKSWNIMISDPRFIRTHYRLSNSDNLFLHTINDSGRLLLGRFEGQEFKTEARISRPLGWQYGTILCIGDGLILLASDIDPKTYMLWNPFARQKTILRLSSYTVHKRSNMYGVCYDPINDDVKVVIGFEFLYEYFYTVYSCQNRSWAEIKELPYQEGFYYHRIDRGLSVDGAIYWICRGLDRSRIILCFDSKEDSFKILQKPETIKDDQRVHLKARKGRLYLCCYGRRTVEIWIKEQSGCSWKAVANIDNPYEEKINYIEFATEHEMIMCVGYKRYCIYNCCDKSYRGVVSFSLQMRGSTLHSFVGSMFPPVMKRESKRKRKPSNALLI